MNFTTYSVNEKTFYGAVAPDGVIELSSHFPKYKSLRDVIENNGLSELEKFAETKAPTHEISQCVFDIPIPNAEKIICVGVNYFDKNSPYSNDEQKPEFMSLFYRTPRSLVGHNQNLIRPNVSNKLDYEAEIALIIAKSGRHIKAENAHDYVAGLAIANEGSVRDWVAHSKFNVTPGKNFENSGAIGFMTPVKNKSDLENISLQCHVNGELRQDDNSNNMIFSIAEQIEYISTFTTLVAGDIILTGTPAGSGARLNPPVFLQPNDKIEISATGIHPLINGVENEK